MVFSFRLINLLKCHSVKKKKKKLTDKWQSFPSTQFYAIKFFSMERSSTKGRQMIKEIIWLACTKCYTTHQIWGQEEFFSQRLMETVKVFTCLWRKELSTVSLKSPISAYCQYHGLWGDQVVMGVGCCECC